MTQLSDPRRGWTSASSAEYDLLCPARHLAQKGLSEGRSLDADFGQRIHAALAKRNPEGLDSDESDVFAACMEIEGREVAKFFPGIDPKKLVSFPEHRLWVKFIQEIDGAKVTLEHSAQPDRVYRVIGYPRALVIEYKTLTGDVPESPRNLQLRDQAVLVKPHYLVSEVGVMVIQPFVTHQPEICLYQEADLVQAEQEMFVRVRASNDPRSGRIPGDRQCKFCLAAKMGTCIEYQRWAGGMMPVMLSLMDVAPKDWPPETRKFFCDRFDIAQKWLNDCWAAMETGATADPKFIPGYAMQTGAIREEIVNPQPVFERYIEIGGTPESFLECVKVIKTRLKDRLKIITGASGIKLEAKLKELASGCIEAKPNKASLKKVEER